MTPSDADRFEVDEEDKTDTTLVAADGDDDAKII